MLGKYSIGIGDRFGMQGCAQLKALQLASQRDILVTPVWNKSNREHAIIGSKPIQTFYAAENAVKKLNWTHQWFTDADHINLSNVDKFIDACNFFTIDVADYIGQTIDTNAVNTFIENATHLIGTIKLSDNYSITISATDILVFANKYLAAINEAKNIYNHIKNEKKENVFLTEISMDETDEPQTPTELLLILYALSQAGVMLQTIAPRFSGRFNKGVDYVGDVNNFEKEFESDILVIQFAQQRFKLPSELKLSVHSGSDKFSIYPCINHLIKKHNVGLHLKTAGTTWLEECIGLAMMGDEALDLVKGIYGIALSRIDELCKPYASVINIDRSKLPTSTEIIHWNAEKMADTIRHIPNHPDYNPNIRQLLHVGYKVAAEYGPIFTDLLTEHASIVGKQVTTNLLERHILPVFGNIEQI